MYSGRLLKVIVFPCLLFLSIAGYAQERIITGRITDSKDGSALAGSATPGGDANGWNAPDMSATYTISVNFADSNTAGASGKFALVKQ